jgi:hypothetical protein
MAPVTPPFADVLNSYMRHVVHELYPDTAVHEGLEKAIRSYVVELHTPAREHKSESEMANSSYISLSLLFSCWSSTTYERIAFL